MKRWSTFVLLIVLGAAFAAAGEKSSSTVQFTVITDQNSKPVRNAEIILHGVDKQGKQKREGLEVKTHQDGTAKVEGIPYGKVRIQVYAHGFRTYGEDFQIAQPTHEITIKLQKPIEQHSIYK